MALDEQHIYLAGGFRSGFTTDAVIYDVKGCDLGGLPLPFHPHASTCFSKPSSTQTLTKLLSLSGNGPATSSNAGKQVTLNAKVETGKPF